MCQRSDQQVARCSFSNVTRWRAEWISVFVSALLLFFSQGYLSAWSMVITRFFHSLIFFSRLSAMMCEWHWRNNARLDSGSPLYAKLHALFGYFIAGQIFIITSGCGCLLVSEWSIFLNGRGRRKLTWQNRKWVVFVFPHASGTNILRQTSIALLKLQLLSLTCVSCICEQIFQTIAGFRSIGTMTELLKDFLACWKKIRHVFLIGTPLETGCINNWYKCQWH